MYVYLFLKPILKVAANKTNFVLGPIELQSLECAFLFHRVHNTYDFAYQRSHCHVLSRFHSIATTPSRQIAFRQWPVGHVHRKHD